MTANTPLLIAIDQGTTNTKVALVDCTGTIRDQESSSLRTHYPQPGWAEQSAEDIWLSVRQGILNLLDRHPVADIAGIGITNQRESVIAWDASSGQPVGPCIIWQCRRTSEACAALMDSGADQQVIAKTGLGINPLFPASKIRWILEHASQARYLRRKGCLRVGTVDSWLLWQLTGGVQHATDHSNASRTQLFNTQSLRFDDELCALFGVPRDILPEPRASNAHFGVTHSDSGLPAGIAILTMLGDSHAALYGHGAQAPGTVKATYGTGSSLMTLTPERVLSTHGLSGTIAWTRDQQTCYALEGNITVSAQAAAFCASLLGIDSAEALSSLAQEVQSSAGVSFVPALAGLGAPYWKDDARGIIAGLSLGSTPAHVARATFEAIALQVNDVFMAMEHDSGSSLTSLLADGGASANAFLMQLQADVLNRPVIRSDVAEVGILGVARMAFPSVGVDPATQFVPAKAETFVPSMAQSDRDALLSQWQKAIGRC